MYVPAPQHAHMLARVAHCGKIGVPNPIERVRLPALSEKAVIARENLRRRLAEPDADPFESQAHLTAEAFAREPKEVIAELRQQLRLEEKLGCSTDEDRFACDGVYEDAFCVARSHSITRAFGLTMTVSLLHHTACPYLHQDNVEQRAICTIFGRGTEWLREPVSAAVQSLVSVVHDAQAVEDWKTANAAKQEIGSRSGFSSAEEREVVLIRGSKWPGVERHAPLHRSPAIAEGSGDWRLVVKVDAGATLLRRPVTPPPIEEHGHGGASCKDERCCPPHKH